MLTLIAILLFGLPIQAEVLQLVDFRFHRPADSPSCGLLKHRERERLKVIRELEYLTKKTKDAKALLLSNNLLVNKLFMPNETWRDLTGEVFSTVRIPEAMLSEILRLGAGNIFLITRGPGFIWHSFAYQLPDGMSIQIDLPNKLLHIRFLTYLNVVCLGEPAPPVVEWIPTESTPKTTSWDLI